MGNTQIVHYFLAVLPEYFPKIFGKSEKEPLDRDAALTAMRAMTKAVNEFMKLQHGDSKEMSVEDVALGFIDVANETMCRPIRSLTEVLQPRLELF